MEKPIKILIVEDDLTHLHLISEALASNRQYRILSATNTAKAMTIAEEHMPSLIICDYYLPQENGFAFCTKIRNHPKLHDTMFMMLTAATETEKKVEGFGIGVDDYVTKPFDPQEFFSRVSSLLRIKSLTEELKRDKEELEELNRELEEGLMGVINLLTQLIGLRVPGASVRGQRAAEMMEWMAKQLDLPESAAKLCRISAQLHEIGKITVSDELLSKNPSQLLESDLEKISHFPVMGQLLIGGIPQLKDVGTILRHQMEHFDGTGYPDRLMRDEIPIASRLLRGVNLVEQASAAGKVSTDTLVERVQRSRGTLLDPKIVQLLAEYLRVNNNSAWMEGKRQISVYELQEGMVLASDLCTGSGIKLLPQDSTIHMSTIQKIIAHHHFDPIINHIYIYHQA